MIALYQMFIHLFSFSVRMASLFNHKARLFVSGRKNILKKLDEAFNASLLPRPSSLAWFHYASLGEFEQALPLIEQLKKGKEKLKILITFFSPSGYEIRKNYEGADFVFYLPMDTKSNVKRFLDIVNPSLVFFVKYDFWYNYLDELHRRKIPTYLVSANFRKEQFKGMYGKYLRKVLGFFSRIFVQNESSQNILADQGIANVMVSGDLRYDKVSQNTVSAKKIQLVQHFQGNNNLIVCGSTWSQDEVIIANCELRTANWKFIIAPHEINEPHILKISSLFPDSLRYSIISKEPVSAALDRLQKVKVLIIDNIGMLSNLYQYADIAYIGGGFGKGIHNILEAVAFGVPVIFGTNHHKFPEANELIGQGGGFSISDENDLKEVMQLLFSDQRVLKMASMICKNFVGQRRGAAEKIMNEVKL